MDDLKKKVTGEEQTPERLTDQELIEVAGGAAALPICRTFTDKASCQSMPHCHWVGNCKPKGSPW